ncbi:topoisomerase DNA-binding C4 zinc finger domain-containing protein [Candidatus Curtissbacteria bacterium]|nr:topoisomerase DNA-binding C4 zinc finger domain-containing protein [Candidatus Curtissbacteria bacterium]
MDTQENCPKCGSSLGEIIETPSGRRLRRCSTGSWNKVTKKSEGCDYVKWLEVAPQTLDEKCPKCDSALVMQVTRFGKKMKKCSKGGWDKEAKKATGCDYVEWINGTTEKLDEKCPECGEQLVLYTTANGKRMKKCSTAGWDREAKKATGCPYIQWLKQVYNRPSNGEEFLPPAEDFAF